MCPRRTVHLGFAGVIAVAAACAIVAGGCGPGSEPAPVELTLAPTRGLAPRLTHGAAARHRPYDVARGAARADAPREAIGHDQLARLERAGDCHGLATAHVLLGELQRAEGAHARCGAGADLDADRAAVALLRGDPERALALADRALMVAPEHPAARWNRALALDELGLGLTAGDDFERAAGAADDWAAEARVRAAAVRAPLEDQRRSWTQILDDGKRMLEGGPAIALDLARRHPWRARILWTNAMRAATTAARLEALRPLAAELEGLAGAGLVAQLDAAHAALSPARARLAPGFARWAIDQAKSDAAAVDRWLVDARRAGLHDLVAATLAVTGRGATAEALALATAEDDPWLLAGFRVSRAEAARAVGDLSSALDELDDAAAICAAHGLAYRCLQVDLLRGRIESVRYRPPEMKRLALRAIVAAEAQGEWMQRERALVLAADAERFRDRFELAAAYYREYARATGTCLARANAASLLADLHFDQHRFAAAAAELTAVDDCAAERPPLTAALATDVSLARAGHPRRARTTLEADLTRARAALAAGDVRHLDLRLHQIRVRLEDDAGARAELDALVHDATAAGAPGARIASDAAAVRQVELGRAGDFAAVLALAAGDRGRPTPDRCALVLASDDFRFVVAVVGADGVVDGAYHGDQPRPPTWLAPAPHRERLAACAAVDVFATAGWFGVGPILEGARAWRYVVGGAGPTTPPAAPHVVVAQPRPPASLGLPPLAPLDGLPADAIVLSGARATPEAALAAMSAAGLIEIHAHALLAEGSDAPSLALSPGAGGWALTAERLASQPLRGAPVVLLADCSGGVPAAYEHVGWGLPAALLGSGARSVVAALAPIPDREGAELFAALRALLARGVPVAAAVAELRAAKIAADPTSWVRDLVVFE